MISHRHSRILLAHLLYHLGDALSRVLDLVATDAPHAQRTVDALYRVYNRLMGWSADLDVDESVWVCRREGETEEECRARAAARWPQYNES